MTQGLRERKGSVPQLRIVFGNGEVQFPSQFLLPIMVSFGGNQAAELSNPSFHAKRIVPDSARF